MQAEDAVRVLNKIGMSASDIEKIMAPMEEVQTITVGEMRRLSIRCESRWIGLKHQSNHKLNPLVRQ